MATALKWRDFGAGRPCHAAFVPIDQRRRAVPHSHADFHELVYVTRGVGEHRLGEEGRQALTAGDLMLVRPHDVHDFVTTDPGGLEFVNVAFASERWRAFVDYAGVTAATAWEEAPMSILVHDAHEVAAQMTARTRVEGRGTTRWIDLIRLWTLAVPLLESALQRPDERPAWLVSACAAMYAEQNLREGLPRLRALAAVSAGHLARSMSTSYGCSPVEFVNRVRLDHAADLLATTTEPIAAIAARCGFAGHAYFTGRFHARFGLAPRDYRDGARRAVVP